MCGIAGIFNQELTRDELKSAAKKMALSIEHRGPDDYGLWFDEEAHIALSHQRLAILDLSYAGHQPMISNSSRYIIAFNGEIYNHLELREKLNKKVNNLKWRSNSDTETLLCLIEYYGIENALSKTVGMFAIALWDRKERKLKLARDRFGEKPIYYGLSGSGKNRSFIFASEISAIKSFDGFDNSINRNALSELLGYMAIYPPNSIYDGIYQLLPGHIITLKFPLYSSLPDQKKWWCINKSIENSFNMQINDEIEGINTLEDQLIKSIKRQSIADVNLGCFLSGGIDSSLISSILQHHSKGKINTFTIGFEESDFNEAPYGKSVASYLGTNHNEIFLTQNDAQEIIPELAKLYSEPFADPSQIPTHLVCREARKSGLKVALSGDGGDELFCGYNRYLWGKRIWSKLNFMPWELRNRIGLAITELPIESLDAFSNILKINQFGHKSHKLAERLKYVKSEDDLYISLLNQWNNISVLMKDYKGNIDLPKTLNLKLPNFLSEDSISRMMAYDSINYLPNDILTKVDRAAMAIGLETRAPFLDHNIFELAWRLPLSSKLRKENGKYKTKWILRKILNKYIPSNLIDRPKAGFAVPLGSWLRGSLKSWVEDEISIDSLENQGYLNTSVVHKLWNEHLSGKIDNSSKLWPILIWQSWYRNNL